MNQDLLHQLQLHVETCYLSRNQNTSSHIIFEFQKIEQSKRRHTKTMIMIVRDLNIWEDSYLIRCRIYFISLRCFSGYLLFICFRDDVVLSYWMWTDSIGVHCTIDHCRGGIYLVLIYMSICMQAWESSFTKTAENALPPPYLWRDKNPRIQLISRRFSCLCMPISWLMWLGRPWNIFVPILLSLSPFMVLYSSFRAAQKQHRQQ